MGFYNSNIFVSCLLLAGLGSKPHVESRSVLCVFVSPCTSGLCEGTFFLRWGQSTEKPQLYRGTHFKPLLISYPCTFHWPKQIIWLCTGIGEKYVLSLLRGTLVSHVKGCGYREGWWIGNNNVIYHRYIKVSVSMQDFESSF